MGRVIVTYLEQNRDNWAAPKTQNSLKVFPKLSYRVVLLILFHGALSLRRNAVLVIKIINTSIRIRMLIQHCQGIIK